MKERNIKVTHCPSTGAYLVRIARLVKTALYCYSVITVVLDCIPFIKWEEMVVESSSKQSFFIGSASGNHLTICIF